MFMHGNFTHLLLNMISLFFIGSFVEKLIGRKRFFWLFRKEEKKIDNLEMEIVKEKMEEVADKLSKKAKQLKKRRIGEHESN